MSELKTVFTSDSRGLDAGVGAAHNKIGALTAQVRALGAAFGVRSALQFAKAQFDAAQASSVLADSLGMSTSGLRTLMAVAETGQMQVSQMEQVVARLASMRLDALSDGGSAAAQSFAKLGITFDQLREMSPEATLEAIGRAMVEGANDSKVMAAAMEMIGTRSARAIEVLRKVGKEGLSDLGREMEKLRMKPFEDSSKTLERGAETWEKFSTAAKSAAANVLAAVTKITVAPFSPERFTQEDAALAETARKAREKRLGISAAPELREEDQRQMTRQSDNMSKLTDAMVRVGGARGISANLMTPLQSLATQQLSELKKIASAVSRNTAVSAEPFLEVQW